MIYKLKVGMKLEDKKSSKQKVVEIVRIPKSEKMPITVKNLRTNKIEKMSRKTLKTFSHYTEVKEKKKSALKIAIDILRKENRPIHINELTELIFADGYILPRKGKTFKNTLSTSLNNECKSKEPRIKKVSSATYSII